jgi:hypothetical protein
MAAIGQAAAERQPRGSINGVRERIEAATRLMLASEGCAMQG